MNWDEIKPALDAKLNPAHVRPPSQFGPKGDYLEGWFVIQEANRIFGHGGWSYVIKGLTENSLKEGENSKGDMQWQAAYTCIVTVTVGDVVREDVGFGSGFAKQIGDAIEGATKEAVTDALKRALRTFGNPFGLALYDKSRANVGVDRDPKAIANSLINVVQKATDADKLNAIMAGEKFDGAWKWLEENHPEESARVRQAVDGAREALETPTPDELMRA